MGVFFFFSFFFVSIGKDNCKKIYNMTKLEVENLQIGSTELCTLTPPESYTSSFLAKFYTWEIWWHLKRDRNQLLVSFLTTIVLFFLVCLLLFFLMFTFENYLQMAFINVCVVIISVAEAFILMQFRKVSSYMCGW